METDNQLSKVTNQWFLALLIIFGVASAFYFWPAIVVENIGPIEFSQTLSEFNEKVGKHLDTIKPNIYYDFLFIVVYSILFYMTYRVFQSSMRIPVSKMWIILCLLPGAFDIIENILILGLLNNTENSLMFDVFWIVVRAKWTLVIPFILINVTILIYYFIRFVNSFFQ